MRLLVSRQLTLHDYITLLRDLTSWHAALDARICRKLHSLSLTNDRYDWQPRQAWLARDLYDLGVNPHRHEDAARLLLPSMATVHELVGVMYVIEGATQGGKVVAPLLERQLGLTETFGAHFFNAHRQGRWQLFRAWIQGPGMHINQEAAARAAIQTFMTLNHHLDQTARNAARAERTTK